MSSVVNIVINENGLITNSNDVLEYIESLGTDLNAKEYVGNLNQYLIFNKEIKNPHAILKASSLKLKDCIAREIDNAKEEKDISIFNNQKSLTRY